MIKSNYSSYISNFIIDKVVDYYYTDESHIIVPFIKVLQEKISIPDSTKMTSYILDKMRTNFIDCLQPSTRRGNDTICKIIRMHNIDIRSEVVDDDGVNLISSIQIIYTIIVKGLELNKSPKYIVSILKTVREAFTVQNNTGDNIYLFDLLADYMKTENLEKLFFDEESNKTLKKEFYDRASSIEVAKVRNFIFSKFQNIDIRGAGEYLMEILSDISQPSVTPIIYLDIIKKKFEKLASTINLINDLYMDMYCLLRIFKKYIRKESDPADHPDESRNIIIYTGNKHTENYVNFFIYHAGFEIIGQEYINHKTLGIVNNEEELRRSKGFCVDMKYDSEFNYIPYSKKDIDNVLFPRDEVEHDGSASSPYLSSDDDGSTSSPYLSSDDDGTASSLFYRTKQDIPLPPPTKQDIPLPIISSFKRSLSIPLGKSTASLKRSFSEEDYNNHKKRRG